MPRDAPLIAAFNEGELSPLMEARVDVDARARGAARLENMLPLVQGPVTRRPGLRFVNAAKHADTAARLLPFVFSPDQSYVLEFGHLYVRFYRDGGLLESAPDTPVEVATPYAEADLADLRYAQSNDVLYLAHPGHAPQVLSRTSDTTWTLAEFANKDGPYRTANETAVTFTPSAINGTVTITASADSFAAEDVGRLVALRLGVPAAYPGSATAFSVGDTTVTRVDSVIRSYRCIIAGTTAQFLVNGPEGDYIADGTCTWKFMGRSQEVWGWGRITAYTDTTHVTAEVEVLNGFTQAAPTTRWRLGAWRLGAWPRAVALFEERLCWAGTAEQPQTLWLSRTAEFDTYTDAQVDGTVLDDHSLSLTLLSPTITWLADHERALLVGTVGGPFAVRAGDGNSALTPTNVVARRITNAGCSTVVPTRADRQVLYVQRLNRRLREIAYAFEDDGFRAPDLSVLAEHLPPPGLAELAWQAEPWNIVWARRSDGALLSLTYQRDQKVLAWARHPLVNGAVEGICTIPRTAAGGDELWAVVRRTINGATVRYVERMAPRWEEADGLETAPFSDCHLVYSGAATATLSGLEHLEGETVSVLAGGAAHPDRTVSGGAITLSRSVTDAVVGLPMPWLVRGFPIEAGAAVGTAQGKTKRIHRMVFRLYETLGLKFGGSEDALDEMVFRSAGDPMDAPPPLFTGDKEEIWPGGNDARARIVMAGDQPLPATILACLPELVTP